MKKLIWGTPKYKYVHNRLRSVRGLASDSKCVDCEDWAKDWSYIHGKDPMDIMGYVARCQSCHRKYDYSVEGNHRAKLTEDQVREIRFKYANGSTRKQLAIEYGIAQSTAANVALGIKYKNVGAHNG